MGSSARLTAPGGSGMGWALASRAGVQYVAVDARVWFASENVLTSAAASRGRGPAAIDRGAINARVAMNVQLFGLAIGLTSRRPRSAGRGVIVVAGATSGRRRCRIGPRAGRR